MKALPSLTPGSSVMLYVNWHFTLISLSIAQLLLLVAYVLTRRIKKTARAGDA